MDYTDFLQVLPRINTPHLNSIYVKYCGLPISSYKIMLDKLNVSTADSLQIISVNREANSTHVEMGSSLFKGLSFLKKLVIGGTDDVTIRDNFLKEMPNLKEFDLHNSIVTDIERFNFSVLPQLESLLIYKTNLNNIDGWFNNLLNLKGLYLFQNKLRRVERSSFDGLNSCLLYTSDAADD